jgi:hypothetical protein
MVSLKTLTHKLSNNAELFLSGLVVMLVVGNILISIGLMREILYAFGFSFNNAALEEIFGALHWIGDTSSSLGVLPFVLFVVVALLCFVLKSSNSDTIKEEVETRDWIYTYAIFLTGILLSIFVFSFRYLSYLGPMGADTSDYLFFSNLMLHGTYSGPALLYGLRDFITLLFVGLRQITESFLGMSFIQSLMLFPIILGVMYSAATYYFVKVGTLNRKVALLATFAVPLTFLTIRVTWDLFTQLLGLTMMLLFFATYIDTIRKPSNYRIAFASAMLLLTTVAYFWSAIYCVVIVIGYLFKCKIDNAAFLREKTRKTLLMLSPFIVLSCFAILSTPILSHLVEPFSVGDAIPLSLPSHWYGIALQDSPIIWILALVGCIFLRKKTGEFGKLILAWTSIVLLSIVLLGFIKSERILILLPIPTLVALGIYRISSYFMHLKKSTDSQDEI